MIRYTKTIPFLDAVEKERIMPIVTASKSCTVLQGFDNAVEILLTGTPDGILKLGMQIGEVLMQIRQIRTDQRERTG